MFTGIIEKKGLVLATGKTDRLGALLCVRTGFSDLALGESVAVNGVCLTVTDWSDVMGLADRRLGDVCFFLSAETLERTNLCHLRVHSTVNLERALTLQSRLSGHWVQGHVDGIARVIEVQKIDSPAGTSYKMRFALDRSLGRYCVEKGSIALNGVSLTVNSLEDGPETVKIDVLVIPHTWRETNLSDLGLQDPVNVEVDILAKYAERVLLCRTS